MGILPRSGVYAIRNLLDGKLYIGSAQNLKHRKAQHFSDLRCGRHASRHLQRAYDRDNIEAFVFEVLEECHINELIAREQAYIDYYQTANPQYGYNTRPTAESNRGHTFSEEVRAKMRAAFNRDRKPMDSEARRRGDETRKGAKRTDAFRERMRQVGLSRDDLRLSTNVIAEMRWLFQQGYSKTEIANRLGINRRTVWRYLRDDDE